MSPIALVGWGLVANTALTHWGYSLGSSFYPAFSPKEQHEWLAWCNTGLFQLWFLSAYWMGLPPLQVAMTYLVYNFWDTVHMSLYKWDPLLYAHHGAAAAMTLAVRFQFPEYAYEVSRVVIFLETSNILLAVAWCLNRAGYGHTLVAKAIGGAALVVYVTNRCIVFPWRLLTESPWPVIGLLGFTLPLNLYWSWSLLGYYRYMLRSRGRRAALASNSEQSPEA